MSYNPVTFSRKDTQQFFQTIRQRVNEYFEENNIEKTGNIRMYFKTLVIFIIYFLPLVLVVTIPMTAPLVILMYAIMGLGKSGIGMGVMHDANHGSYSKYQWVNKLMAYSLNMIGGSTFTWHIQHNVKHHTFTNVYELDEDIDDKPFLRLSPHGILKPYHRFQHKYALAIYSLATISWILFKDFKQLRQYNKLGLTRENGFNPIVETIVMVITKLVYVGYAIILPISAGATWWAVILGFVIMHLVAGFLITTVFQLAHVVEGPDHFIPDPNGDKMDNTWAIHQLKTTANFATKNVFLVWLIGGLNHQVEHHLFPKISHMHYAKIAKIVKATAQECNLPYYEHEGFRKAIVSHLKVLKDFGNMNVSVSA
jgi:linoleoyl-CoA desaturase